MKEVSVKVLKSSNIDGARRWPQRLSKDEIICPSKWAKKWSKVSGFPVHSTRLSPNWEWKYGHAPLVNKLFWLFLSFICKTLSHVYYMQILCECFVIIEQCFQIAACMPLFKSCVITIVVGGSGTMQKHTRKINNDLSGAEGKIKDLIMPSIVVQLRRAWLFGSWSYHRILRATSWFASVVTVRELIFDHPLHRRVRAESGKDQYLMEDRRLKRPPL